MSEVIRRVTQITPLVIVGGAIVASLRDAPSETQAIIKHTPTRVIDDPELIGKITLARPARKSKEVEVASLSEAEFEQAIQQDSTGQEVLILPNRSQPVPYTRNLNTVDLGNPNYFVRRPGEEPCTEDGVVQYALNNDILSSNLNAIGATNPKFVSFTTVGDNYRPGDRLVTNFKFN